MVVLGALVNGIAVVFCLVFKRRVSQKLGDFLMRDLGLCVFVYDAALSLAASALAPFPTDAVIAEMVCAGSLLLLAIGLNMLKITDIKVANFLSAAFLPIAFCAIPGLMQPSVSPLRFMKKAAPRDGLKPICLLSCWQARLR